MNKIYIWWLTRKRNTLLRLHNIYMLRGDVVSAYSIQSELFELEDRLEAFGVEDFSYNM